MTPEEFAAEKAKIEALTQEEACRTLRFAPAGHPWFIQGSPLSKMFQAKFQELGGMTPGISKRIGWER